MRRGSGPVADRGHGWGGGDRSASARDGWIRIGSGGIGEPEAAVEAPEGSIASSAAQLQDGEIVLLALRPSRWLVALHLSGSLAFVALALILAVRGFGGAITPGGLGVALGLAAVTWLPVGAWFVMDWRSHRYVLTNRRVIAGVGMVRAFTAEAPLAAVRRVMLQRSLAERAMRIGTVRFVNPHGLEVARWSLVSGPEGVRRTVLEALRKYGRVDVEE